MPNDTVEDMGAVAPDNAGSGGDAANYLVPKMGEMAVSSAAKFQSMYMTSVHQPKEKLKPLEGTVDPFAELSDKEASSTQPALGVLLTHEQGWYQVGLALGQLLHSLCLAPGEITKVAVIDWQRRTSSTSSSATDQSEDVSADKQQNLGTNEVQNAVATEVQAGMSTTASVSTQSQAAANHGWLAGGVSASTAFNASIGIGT